MTVLKLRKVRHWDTVSRPTLDTILTNATDAELAAYMTARAKMNPGIVWDGYFKPMLEAMDKATRDTVLSNLTNYGNELGKSKSIGETEASGLIFGGENDDEEERQTESNGATGPTRTGDAMRKWRGQDHDRIANVQKANEAFWKK